MRVKSSEINPITKTDYPDPDIIRVGNIYYIISTTMYFFPGGEILRSYDLVHWEIAARIFDSLDDSAAERLENGENCYGKGMWAASLRFHNGRFYVVFVSHGQEDTHLFVSGISDGNDPAKCTWEHRRMKGYYHDCSLLFDDDGRVFLVHGNMQIHLTELADDLTGPKEGGIDKIIIQDEPERVILGYEGSHFYKIDGRYYITLIHWPKSPSRRTEAVFVCDTVDGTYIGRDVCADDMGYHNMGVAQGGIVDTPDGQWYSVMFRDSGAVGSMPVLTPVTFPTTDKGIDDTEQSSGKSHLENFLPVFGEGGTIPEEFDVPDGNPGYVYEPLFTSDEFCFENKAGKPVLKPQWQWNHVPDERNWTIIPEGGLKITTQKVCTNLIQARNVLTQRMCFPGCAAEVTVDGSLLQDGDFAGLCVHQGCYGFIGLMKEAGRTYLVNLVKKEPVKGFGIGSSDTLPGEITEQIMLETDYARVRIAADFANMKDTAQFFFEKDGSFVPVGNVHKLAFRLDHFTGARFGLAVFSTNQAGGSAVFTHFRYEKQK